MKFTIKIDIDEGPELLDFQDDQVRELVLSFCASNKIDPLEMSTRKELRCSKCSSKNYVKNGIASKKQRYKCSDCGKTFSSATNTALHGLKLTKKWSNFIFLMLSPKVPYSLTELSKKLQISRLTAHRWKQKLLSCMIGQAKIQFDGPMEFDEIFEPFSLKGQRKDSRSEIENQYHENGKKQAVFACAHNRDGDFDFYPLRVQSPGQVHSRYISEAATYFKIGSGSTVITDKGKGARLYFSERDEIEHLTFKSKSGETDFLHNNNINVMRKHFKLWKKHFHGYSTKYIWNYLVWYRFHKMFVNHIQNEMNLGQSRGLERMVRNSISDSKGYVRYKNINRYYDEYLKRA